MVFMRSRYYVGRRRGKITLPMMVTVALLGAGALFFVLMRPITDGTVVDSYDGHPLDNVRVTLGKEQARTDPKGRFSLTPKRTPDFHIAYSVQKEAPAVTGSVPWTSLAPNCSTSFSNSRTRRITSGNCCIAIHCRFVCLSGIAGIPSTVPPAGMSRITPDFAPTVDWKPYVC